MRRKQMTQLSNQKWFPKIWRTCMHEFMTWFVGIVGAAQPFLPVINEGLKHSKNIIGVEADVGAGFETAEHLLDSKIPIQKIPIDKIDGKQKGLYILVNTLHQLPPDKAKAILEKIARHRNPIVVVEGNNDSLWQVFGMLIIVPMGQQIQQIQTYG